MAAATQFVNTAATMVFAWPQMSVIVIQVGGDTLVPHIVRPALGGSIVLKNATATAMELVTQFQEFVNVCLVGLEVSASQHARKKLTEQTASPCAAVRTERHVIQSMEHVNADPDLRDLCVIKSVSSMVKIVLRHANAITVAHVIQTPESVIVLQDGWVKSVRCLAHRTIMAKTVNRVVIVTMAGRATL